jgi:protein-disulfide isomerase
VVAILLVLKYMQPAPATSRAVAPVVGSVWTELVSRSMPLHGDSAYPVKLIKITDLQCPACRGYHEVLRQVEQRYPNELYIGYAPYPVEYHLEAPAAARIAECAYSAGQLRPFVDLMYRIQDSLPAHRWSQWLGQVGVGLSADSVARCLSDSSAAAQQVEAGRALVSQLGISGTPTIVLNGYKYSEPPPADRLIEDIARALDGQSPRTDRW